MTPATPSPAPRGRPAKIAAIEALGARGVVADAFDAEALRRAVIAAKPDVVIHQLTDLPDVSDPTQMAAVREKNSRLRIEGTRNLMAAAKAAGVRRVVAQSIAFVYAPGPKPLPRGRSARFERGPARDHRRASPPSKTPC